MRDPEEEDEDEEEEEEEEEEEDGEGAGEDDLCAGSLETTWIFCTADSGARSDLVAAEEEAPPKAKVVAPPEDEAARLGDTGAARYPLRGETEALLPPRGDLLDVASRTTPTLLSQAKELMSTFSTLSLGVGPWPILPASHFRSLYSVRKN